MKHTKGEWYFIDYAGFFCIVDEPFYEGKMLLDAEQVGYETATANAKLAAAAPVLLRQLQNCVSVLKTIRDIEGLQKQDLVSQSIEKANAAIKKAGFIGSTSSILTPVSNVYKKQ